MRDFEHEELERAAANLERIANLLGESLEPTAYEPGVIRIANPDPEGVMRDVRALRDISRRHHTPPDLADALRPFLADADDVDAAIGAMGLDDLGAETCGHKGCPYRAWDNGWCMKHQPVTT